MSAGFVAVPVVPTFKGMSKEFSQRLEKPAQESGKRAGAAMSKGLESAVENIERQVRASSSKLKDLDRDYEVAYSKQVEMKEKAEAATVKLQAAEEKYQEAVAKGKTGTAEYGKVLDAKAAQTKANRNLEQAEIDVRVAEEKHKNQLDDLNDTLAKLQDSQSELNRELEKSSGAFGGAKGKIQSMADSAKDGAVKFGDFAEKYKLHATAALGGIGLIAKESMAYAAEAEQSYGAVESIFADHAQGIIDKSKQAATEVGVSGREYRELSANMGAMLKNMGMPMDEVADKSQNLVGVAADLAATFGGTTKEAVESVTSLLRGETDPIEKYGVSIKQADIEARMAADGLDNLSGEAEKQAKAQTLLKLLTEQTAAAQGQFARETDTAAHKQQVATAKYNDAKEAIGTALLPIMAELADKAASVAQVIGEHPAIFIAVAGAVGTLSAAIVGAAMIAPILTAWSAAATAANMSMMGLAASTIAAIAPVAAVVAAVAALGAALWAFFTKTETGRKIWETFTKALSEAWDKAVEAVTSGVEWLKGAFNKLSGYLSGVIPALQAVAGFIGGVFMGAWNLLTSGITWAWEKVIQPIFNAILQVAKVTIGVIGTLILAPLLVGWNVLSAGIQAGWENIIRPVWEAIVSYAQNTLWPIVQGVFGFISGAWQALADAMGVVWSWLQANIFAPFMEGLSNLAAWFKARVDDIVAIWQWFQGLMQAGWQFIDSYVLAPLRAGWQLVADWFRARVDDMLAIWQGFQNLLRAGWEFIEGNVFAPLGKGLYTLQDWFRDGVEGIGRIWDGLRAVAAKPVKFVIDTVWNNGILKAWNAIAEFLPGINTVNKIDLGQLGGYAQGGVLPGYTPGRDVHDFYSLTGGMIHLSGGEAIMRPEWTRAVGGKKTVDRMNALAKAGKLDKDLMAIGLSHGTLGAFANGGVIGAMANIVRAKYPMLQLTSGYRPGDRGMHGAGLASDWSNGHGNTPQQLALAHDIARTYPGSAELIYDSPGWSGNIKNGQNVGAFGSFYTMAQAGPHHHHVHWAMTTAPNIQFGGGVFEGGSNGGPGGPGGGFFNWIADKAKGIWSDMVDPLKRRIEDMREDSKFWDIPFGFLETIKDKAWSFLSSKFGSGGGVNSGSVDTSDVSGAVAEQVETVFARHGFTGADWEAAKWIIGKESGWNPTATNPSSGAYGLFQFNPMGGNTLASYLPDRNPDPAVQADAGARYIKDRYGSPSAAKAFWERNGWYASGGVVELPKLYDQGGWLEHGKSAVNLSGKPEPVLNPDQWKTIAQMIRSGASMGDVARELGRLVPQLKQQTEAFARFADNAQAWMSKAGDYNTAEGINARQSVRRVLDLGLDLPGSEQIKVVLDGEKALWDSRARAVGHTEALAAKEQELAEAKKKLRELETGEVELSVKDKRKLADAEKALAEAQAEAGQSAGGSASAARKVADAEEALAKARKSGNADKIAKAEKRVQRAREDSSTSSEKANDKVAKAEEKLARVREDLGIKQEKDEAKRAEEIEKATEAVSKAEGELATARRKQAEDLDNVVLVSQQQIEGLIPQAEALASKLVGMGAPAGAVGAGLDMVVGKLAGIAGLAGPTGITLGMAMDLLKVGINIIKSIVGAIIELIHKIQDARIAAVKTLADGLQVIADYAELNLQLQTNVAELQQQLVRGLNEQRVAAFNLEIANRDRMVAEAEGMLAIAQARMKLDGEIERGAKIAQLKMMGLHEDWDSYNAFQAQVGRGMLAQWSDAALSALFTYEKARAEAFQKELNAKLSQLEAEYELAERVRQNARTQADLITAQERLIKMAAQVSGVDLEGATGQAQIAKLMAEMAENQKNIDNNVLGRWGYKMGASGSHATEYRGQLAHQESLRAALEAVARETNVSIDQGRLDSTLKKMSRASFRGGDPMSVLRSEMPELVAAETALKVQETMKPIWDIRDQKRDLNRATEDFRAEVDHFEKTQPLKEQIKGLDYAIRSLEASSAAFAEGNEKVRGEYLAVARANQASAESLGVRWKMDPRYASAHDQVRRETTVVMRGDEMYTADQVDRMLSEVRSSTGAGVKTRISSSLLASARRKELR